MDDMAQKCKFWNNLRFVIWSADEFIKIPRFIKQLHLHQWWVAFK